jgi:hypothetical protein
MTWELTEFIIDFNRIPQQVRNRYEEDTREDDG